MRTPRWPLALALTCLIGAACGKDNGQTPPPDAGSSTYGLALVGDAVLTLHPGDVRTLQVVLAQAEVGPVAGQAIHLSIEDGDPAGATLDKTELTTSAGSAGVGAGVASFKLTAGGKTQFKIVASSVLAGVKPVAFAINVIPVRRLLQIVGSSQVRVSSDGESATVTMYIASSVGLKARLLDQDTGNAIAGETLSFSLASSGTGLAFSGASASSATAVTSAAGDAQVFIVSKDITGKDILVTGQVQSGGVGAVNWSISITGNATSSSCTSSQQCPAGQVCVNGGCTTPTTGGGACGGGNDQPCPFGYDCINGKCVPPTNPSCDINNPNCPSGQTCDCTGSGTAQVCSCHDVCPVCTSGTHCNPSTRTCVPDTVPMPDVTGVWYTQHDFSLKQGLPNFLQQMAKIVAILDQLISGNFFTGALSWLNSIVKSIIDQYVPAWVKTFVKILDTLGTIFSNLRSEGAMKVVAGVDQAHVKATEVWTSLVFYFLPLCPNGRPAGDPTLPPDCARFDVATSDSNNPGEIGQCKGQSIPAISVQVAPFTGNVSGAGTATAPVAPWTMNFDQRQVKMKFGKVILIVINLLLSYLTEYNCIEEALDCTGGNPCLIDCAGLGTTISNATGGIIPAGTVTAICQPLVTQAGIAITNLLAGISFASDVLDFKGHGQIPKYQGSVSTQPGYDPHYDAGACDSGTLCAMQLGDDKWDYNLVKELPHDGMWTGTFFGLLNGMPGAFKATRDPIVH